MAVPIDVESLDFSALGSRPLPRSPRAPGRGFPVVPAALGIGITALALFMTGAVTLTLLTDDVDLGPGTVVGYLLLLAIIAAALWFVVRTVAAPRRPAPEPDRFERFAAVNGLRYAASGTGAPHTGTAFQGGQVRLIDHFGPEFGEDFDYGVVTFVPGITDPRSLRWAYLALRLDRRLPLMVLRSRESRLPGFDGAEVVELPPRYREEYELLAAPGAAAEARALFTPALLTLLSPPRNPFDVEVLGDRVYAYAKPLDPRLPATHRRFLRIARTVWAQTGSL